MGANRSNDGRKTQRVRCRLKGTLRFLHQTVDVRVIDISRSGMALELQGWVEARPGSAVQVRTIEFGMIEGIVRWYRAGKMGIQIDETSNTAAQIAAYFKNFHQALTAVGATRPITVERPRSGSVA